MEEVGVGWGEKAKVKGENWGTDRRFGGRMRKESNVEGRELGY